MGTISRHWNVLRDAWSLDRERGKERRRYEQTEFLPATLEVIETPASPFGRAGLWLLVIAVGLALLWSFFGRLDVVVTATGRVIPVERIKRIQPSELGVVRAIHVADGQRVRAGEVLVELDPTSAGAEDAQAQTGLRAAEIDRARNAALIAYLNGRGLRFQPPPGISPAIAAVQRSLVLALVQDYEARRAVLVRQRSQHAAELAGARAEVAKLAETLPLLERQLAARRSLAERGHYPRLRVDELEEERVERVRNIDVQRAAAARAEASVAGIDEQLRQLRTDLIQTASRDLAQAEDNADLRAREMEKTGRRRDLMRLVSPVDGIVQQLAVHTAGGVVEPAQVLMVIVPTTSELLVEAMVSNRDIGFLRRGRPVRIKVDAFPFTDYGTLDGRLESVSPDAVEHEQLGLVYVARIEVAPPPSRSALRIAPGMAVTAEIRTGSRRVIQYLLSPLAARLDEAGRER